MLSIIQDFRFPPMVRMCISIRCTSFVLRVPPDVKTSSKRAWDSAVLIEWVFVEIDLPIVVPGQTKECSRAELAGMALETRRYTPDQAESLRLSTNPEDENMEPALFQALPDILFWGEGGRRAKKRANYPDCFQYGKVAKIIHAICWHLLIIFMENMFKYWV